MKSKTIIATIICLTIYNTALACDVCQRNQPKGLENITHGQGPNGLVDFIITWSAVVLVVIVLFFSIKFLVKPKESDPDHIKNIVWDDHFRT